MADQSETQIRASLLQNLILLLSLTLFSLVFSFYCLKSLCTHSLDYFLFYCCLNFVSIFSLKKNLYPNMFLLCEIHLFSFLTTCTGFSLFPSASEIICTLSPMWVFLDIFCVIYLIIILRCIIAIYRPIFN